MMNSDFKDLLRIFNELEVEYLVVGGYAAIHYSQPRYTKDLDLWIKPTQKNALAVAKAFSLFGLPMHDFTVSDLADTGFQFFVGCPPCAFDFLTTVKGLEFDPAWENRSQSMEGDLPIWYLGKEDLITAKKAVARDQDLKDIEEIRRADS